MSIKVNCSKCQSDIEELKEGVYKCSNANCNQEYDEQDYKDLERRILKEIEKQLFKGLKF